MFKSLKKIMEEKSLYLRLRDAYSSENLNKITSKILELYKKKQYNYLLKILSKANKDLRMEEEKSSRILAKLMMLYHPDRQNYYLQEIEKVYRSGAKEKLQAFTHIFSVLDLEAPKFEQIIDPDTSFTPQYEWEESERGYSYQSFSNHDDEFYEDFTSDSSDYSFFQVLKRDVYGGLNVELPFFLLEDMDEVELPDRGMDNLDGIEYCKHLKRLDLSNNHLTDIAELMSLTFLEELYLADNQIGYIDAVSNLAHLKIIDLAGNALDDISPLFELEQLEYVNLIGNKIPEEQLNILKDKEIVVVY
jgi:hypothetical protein